MISSCSTVGPKPAGVSDNNMSSTPCAPHAPHLAQQALLQVLDAGVVECLRLVKHDHLADTCGVGGVRSWATGALRATGEECIPSQRRRASTMCRPTKLHPFVTTTRSALI